MSDTATAVMGENGAAEDAMQRDQGNNQFVDGTVTGMNCGVSAELNLEAPKDLLTPEKEQGTASADMGSEDTNESAGKAYLADATAHGSAEAEATLTEADPAGAANATAHAAAEGKGENSGATGVESVLDETDPVKSEELGREADETTSKSKFSGGEARTEDSHPTKNVLVDEAKAEPTSPNSIRKQQKASFNIDAKPFSPVALADPVMQGTIVGEANGVSIKVGQWGAQPYVPLPHISPAASVGVAQVPFAVPGTTQPPPVRKESSGGKESLSAFAKPWSPHPEVTVATIPPPENEVAVHPGSWSITNVEGKDVQTPSPMMPKETSSNSFTHSFSIHPKGLKNVELELYNYVCGRCPLKTLYGRLSSRQPDVTMRNVAMDVPPLCVAHLIEQITKAKVTALCVNEVEGTHYDIWLDKPNMATTLAESISGCVWTCPMHHGFAVLGKGEEGKKYLRNYVDRLRDSRPDGSNVYDVALVEVKEH